MKIFLKLIGGGVLKIVSGGRLLLPGSVLSATPTANLRRPDEAYEDELFLLLVSLK